MGCSQASGSFGQASWETPSFPLKGSFKGDIDIGIDMDINVEIDIDSDSDMAFFACCFWVGSFYTNINRI